MKYPCHLLYFALFIFNYPSFSYGQDTYSIPAHDTLTYQLPVSKSQYWQVKGSQTNLVVALYKNGRIVKEQDDSKGIGSVERIWVEQEKNGQYQLKIWANMFLKEFNSYDVEITPMPTWTPLPTTIENNLIKDDLQAYIAIKRDAHIGTYLYRSPQFMDSTYKALEQKIDQNGMNILDFYKLIARFGGLEGSCHNFTRLPNHLSYYYPIGNHYLPFAVKYNNGKLLHRDSRSSISKGAVILRINDIPVERIIGELPQMITTDGFSEPYKYTGAFTRNWLNLFHIHYGISENYVIQYEWNGKISKASLKGISYKDAFDLQEKQKVQPDKQRYTFKQLEQNLYMLKISGFDFAGSKENPAYLAFERFLENMLDTLENQPSASLVVDLRGNMGGAGILYEKTFTYLSDRAFRDSDYAYSLFNEVPHSQYFNLDQVFFTNNLKNIADGNAILKQRFPIGVNSKYYLADQHNPLILPNNRTFKGQIYLLVDSYVASAGAHLASLIKSYTNAIVIGEETMGGYYEHVGHVPFSYTLPHSKVQVGFSVVYVKQDTDILPDQATGRGIQPHYYINLTNEEAVSDKDFHLKKVREFMKRQ